MGNRKMDEHELKKYENEPDQFSTGSLKLSFKSNLSINNIDQDYVSPRNWEKKLNDKNQKPGLG